MSNCVQLLPLCSRPALVTRDGGTGARAYGNYIGIGIWYASGQTLLGFKDRGPQDTSRTYNGSWKPNTFTKGFSGFSEATCPVPLV